MVAMMKQITVGEHTAIVDEEDFETLSEYKWHINNGYAATSWRDTETGARRSGLMHRMILDAPRGKIVDHFNRNRLDNRRSNLRVVTQAENRQNSLNSDGRLKGVQATQTGFVARIKDGDDMVKLGEFDDSVQAAIAYDDAAQKIYGEHAALNFPDGVPKPGTYDPKTMTNPFSGKAEIDPVIQRSVSLRRSMWDRLEQHRKPWHRSVQEVIARILYEHFASEGEDGQ